MLKMLLFLGSFLFISLIHSSAEAHSFHTIYSMEEASELVQIPNEKVLYVFDIDETLIFWEDRVYRPGNHSSPEGQALEEYFTQNCKYPHDKEYQDRVRSKSFIKTRTPLIEPLLTNFFQTLQKSGKKAVALTNMPSGRFGLISQLEEWRRDKLLELGIDFSTVSPSIDERLLFKHLPQGKCDPPLYHKGILFSNDSRKGSVLSAFLEYVKERFGYVPSLIIFFDDLLHNLESVAESSEQMCIPFKGYHYLGHSLLSNSLDLEIAQIQFHHLIKFEEWLRDEEAATLARGDITP
jgi:hypothetical protein